jgi:hypothetical protein
MEENLKQIRGKNNHSQTSFALGTYFSFSKKKNSQKAVAWPPERRIL